MKTTLLLLSCVLLVHGLPAAQILERGQHHRVVEEERPDGTVSRYTELRSNLHYADQGVWRESTSLIEIFDGAAVFRQSPTKMIFSANLNSPGSVDILAGETRFRVNVLGLALSDRQGNSVLIAGVRDCEGVVHENAIYYFDAFDGGFLATVQYVLTPMSCQQNIILEESFGDPADWGFAENADVFVEVWTELVESPEPAVRALVIESEEDEQKRLQLAEPDLIDRRLDFGAALIAGGRAFALGETGASVPTVKDWAVSPEGRKFIVEKTPYKAAEPHLRRLPAPQVRARPGARARGQGLMARAFPPRPAGQRGSWKEQVAARVPERGYVLDWTLLTGLMTNTTFHATNTYHILGECQLYQTTRFESAVLKFTNNASLHILGSTVFDTALYRPLVLTARDDHSLGDPIGSGTLAGYYASRALWFDELATNDIKHVRISHAQQAIRVEYDTGHEHSLRHAQIDNCGLGLFQHNTTWRLANVLMANVETNFLTDAFYATNHCEHLTVHKSKVLNVSYDNHLLFTNCLLVDIDTSGGWDVYNASNVQTAEDGASVFTSVGAGHHYLKAPQPGTTNISASLAAELRELTTQPPLLLSGSITMDTTLGRVVPRCQGVPKIGYHFPALDYLADTVLVTNATLRLGEGVAVGSFGATAFWVHDFSKLICQGSPVRGNTLVRYYAVQEGTTNRGTVAGPLISGYNHSNSPPDVRLRFTESFVAPGGGWHLYANTSTGWRFNNVEIRDCSLYGGWLYITDRAAATYGLTNNLMRRMTLFSLGAHTLWFRNNLWKDDFGATLLPLGANLFLFYDNLLDTGTLKNLSANLVHQNNAYYQASNFYSSHTTNPTEQVLSSLSYESWGQWPYYLPSGSTLINTGSVMNAASAGFYHYTTTTNQTIEGTSQLDIGIHRIALGTDGLPKDSDGDGIPDAIEDADGDGVADAGETDWTVYDSPNGFGSPPSLMVYTPLR